MKRKYISWRRVSTFKQNKSGLGLEAQKEIIKYFVEREGGEIVADYAECYTGKELSGCVELRKAMAHAKKEGAILVIAKTDRFRNCQEALGILDEMGEGRIEFCDLPHSDRFTLTLFWALAEREALITSIRTKQALAVKKSQGCKLGASSEKYQQTRKNHTKEELIRMARQRGATKNARHLASREIRAFVKILKCVFSDICKGEPTEWKEWDKINTHKENRIRILNMMHDYKQMDSDGALFRTWDFSGDIESYKLQVRLANMINSLRRSCKIASDYQENENKNE